MTRVWQTVVWMTQLVAATLPDRASAASEATNKLPKCLLGSGRTCTGPPRTKNEILRHPRLVARVSARAPAAILAGRAHRNRSAARTAPSTFGSPGEHAATDLPEINPRRG